MGEAKRRGKLGLDELAPRFPGPTMSAASPIRIENPLVIMFAGEGVMFIAIFIHPLPAPAPPSTDC